MRRTALLSLAAAAVALAGCGGSAVDTPSTTPTPTADIGEASAVTPLDDVVVQAAREEGEVLLYTNAEDQQMAPIKEAFERANPGITLRSLALGDEEMFQRYETEVASGTPSADVIMNSDAPAWLSFLDGGNIEVHEDPNTPNLPDYAVLAPGVYAVSLDPVIAVFNTVLLPESEQPTTMAQLAEMAPGLDGRIATTDIGNSVQFGATSTFVDRYGDAGWQILETIGGHAGVEASNGPLVTKLAQGQYAAAFFVAGGVRAFITDDIAQVVNYRYLEDGTPLRPRAVGVTSEAAHPNAAKLFVNWLLSVEGQEVACTGGFTPYRDGVPCEFGLPQVTAAVGGEQNLVIGSFDRAVVQRRDELVARWNEAFGR
jgi:iron(III) transport system substrate-binding protein